MAWVEEFVQARGGAVAVEVAPVQAEAEEDSYGGAAELAERLQVVGGVWDVVGEGFGGVQVASKTVGL